MLEKLQDIKNANEPITLDEKLIGRIGQLKRDGDYGDVLEACAEFVDVLHNEGISREELGEVPAFHVLIGSTIPSKDGTLFVEKTILPERQREIERKISSFIDEQLEKLAA